MENLNNIILTGIINNIEFSHRVKGVSYSKATLLVKNSNDKESLINLSFKTNTNPGYVNGDTVSIIGNIRSRAVKISNQKTSVFVFTYFDIPILDEVPTNQFSVNGQIVKKSDIHEFKGDRKNIQLTLLNVLNTDKHNIASFLPCIAWNTLADQLSQLPIGTNLILSGELRSREYTKYLSDEEYEFHVAHELLITHFEVINEEDI